MVSFCVSSSIEKLVKQFLCKIPFPNRPRRRKPCTPYLLNLERVSLERRFVRAVPVQATVASNEARTQQSQLTKFLPSSQSHCNSASPLRILSTDKLTRTTTLFLMQTKRVMVGLFSYNCSEVYCINWKHVFISSLQSRWLTRSLDALRQPPGHSDRFVEISLGLFAPETKGTSQSMYASGV